MVNAMASMQKLTRIGIVGRGAIGVNMALHLQDQAKFDTTLLLRDDDALTTSRKAPLRITTTSGESHTIRCSQTYLSPQSIGNLDVIIIPVKQYQLAPLLKTISPYLNKTTILLLLHNGMGGIELAEKYAPENTIMAATTTDGVYKNATNEFMQTAIGNLDIGFVNDKLATRETSQEKLMETLKSLHPNVRWRNDIVFALYQKLAINAVINPLTALKNCKNGELENHQKEVNEVKNEVFDLYEFMNLPIDTHQLSQQIDEVIALTKENYSSMHQDFHHHRETEIEGILGFLLNKGSETGMKMAATESLYEQIKAQTSK